MRYKILGGALALLAAVALAACGGTEGLSASQAPTVQPTATAAPTPVPASQPITFSGSGNKVMDPVDVPAGYWRLAWHATGSGNFAVTAHGQRDALLVNEILPDQYEPNGKNDGEAAFNSAGGRFVFDVQAGEATWTITLTRVSA